MNNGQFPNNLFAFLFELPNIIYTLNEINQFISNQYEQMKHNFELLLSLTNINSNENNVENNYQLNSSNEKNLYNFKNIYLGLINEKKKQKKIPFFTVTYRKTK